MTTGGGRVIVSRGVGSTIPARGYALERGGAHRVEGSEPSRADSPSWGADTAGKRAAQEPAWTTHRHATPWPAEIDGAERRAPRGAEGSRASAMRSGVQLPACTVVLAVLDTGRRRPGRAVAATPRGSDHSVCSIYRPALPIA